MFDWWVEASFIGRLLLSLAVIGVGVILSLMSGHFIYVGILGFGVVLLGATLLGVGRNKGGYRF